MAQETNNSMSVYLYRQPMTGLSFIKHLEGYIRLIRTLDPIFDTAYLMKKSLAKSPLIQKDMSNFYAECKKYFEESDIAFVNSDKSDPNFYETSLCYISFDAGIYFPAGGTSAWISANYGQLSDASAHNLQIRLPPDFLDAARLRAIFVSTVQYMLPYTACTMNNKAIDQLNDTSLSEAIWVGWLTYLPDPAAAAVVPPGVAVERVGPGIVLQATPKPPAPDDSAGIGVIRELRQRLLAHGFLKPLPK